VDLPPRSRRRCLWRARLGLALGTLVLGVADAGLAQNQPGQTPASAQQLIDRLRQIQGELQQGKAGQGEGDVGAAGATAAPQPVARLSADQVRQRIGDALGVQVLRVERVAAGERPTYALRVMNPPGNYNAAFRVVTLLVDGDTGEVLGEVQATPDAEDPDAFPTLRKTGDQDSGLELRRRTWR
jgi:hypothetical protein